MTFKLSESNPIASIAEYYLQPICGDRVLALTMANHYADFILNGGIFPNYWHKQAIDWMEKYESNKYPEHVNEKVTIAIVRIHEHIKKRRLVLTLDAKKMTELLTKGEKLQPFAWQNSKAYRNSHVYIQGTLFYRDMPDTTMSTSIDAGVKKVLQEHGTQWVILREPKFSDPVADEEIASARPWTYHSAPSKNSPGNRDWIEDARGRVILENVGRIDGPLICAAVNERAQRNG